MSGKKPAKTASAKYVENLAAITKALELLVAVLPNSEFLLMFVQLHKKIADEYWAETGVKT